MLDNLHSELNDLLLSFNRNKDWDEVSKINERDDELEYTTHSTRKCKSLQSIQICATIHHADDDIGIPNDKMKVSLKIGRHKYHRSPFYTSSAYEDMMNEYKELNKNSAQNMEEFNYDLDTDNAEKEALQAMHWIIDHDILDVMDSEWNDPLKFKTKQLRTEKGREMIRKCKAAFCICQYVNFPDDGGQKHPCKPAIRADSFVVSSFSFSIEFASCYTMYFGV